MDVDRELRPAQSETASKPPTFYIALIQTKLDEAHLFAFLVQHEGIEGEEVLEVVYNDVGFRMPDDAIFIITQHGATRHLGEQIPVRWIAPYSTLAKSVPHHRRYRPPEELRGQDVPPIEPEVGAIELFESIQISRGSRLTAARRSRSV